MSRWAMIVATMALMCAFAASPAKADQWPWCADMGGDRGGTTNCGFASWEQCQVNIRGIGGWCYPNPYYRPGPPERRRSRRYR
jgi:hypothetical protein